MGMQTSASVAIRRPAAEVFRWLVEPERLAAWTGSAGIMPADPAVLAAGFETTGTTPGVAGGETRLRIDAWDPPHGLTLTITYAGGDATTTYALAEADGVTTLTCSSDTDWARPDLTGVEAQVAAQPPEVQAAMRSAMDAAYAQLGAGAFDAGTQAMLQSSLEDSLARLRDLVEAEG